MALLLFGGSGKISSIMGDVAKGIKSFKKGMSEDDETAKKEEPAKKDEPAKVIEARLRPSPSSSNGHGAQQDRLEPQA